MPPERVLGRSGLPVSRIGLGLAALGRPGYINLGHAADLASDYAVSAMERRTHAVLDAAWDAGVRYFDAARSYGRAELFLASWLASRKIPQPAVTVGSKWGYTYTAGWKAEAEQHEVKDLTATVLRRQLAESRAILGPHLDLYQIHSATLESGVLEQEDVLEELARLRDAGVFVGLTLTGPRQAETLDRAMAAVIGGRPLFDGVQATWNLLERSAEAALARARAAGLGVIVKEALANGRLTARNADPAFAESRRCVERVAAGLGGTLDGVALAAALAQPWADVVLSGAATVAQLHSNLAACSIELDADTLHRLDEVRERAEEYWAIRGRLAWN